MKNYFLTILSLISVFQAFSQDSEMVYPKCELIQRNKFVYRLITQEYMTNENGYFLAVTNDTSYYHFNRTEKSLVYKVSLSKSDSKLILPTTPDTLKKMTLEVEFQPNGKVKSLVNWKAFRDVFVSSASAQARQAIISTEEFNETKDRLNDEGYVRRLVMEDLNYIFVLSGDTFDTEVEYIRLKTIRSPFSGYDYYFQGTLKLEKPPGTKNTMLFHAQNAAGPAEKPLLMQEAKEFYLKRLPKDQPATEIKAVDLNSEQSYQYNLAQNRMIKVTLSDVVVLDNSSRGNIRIYDLWDIGDQ